MKRWSSMPSKVRFGLGLSAVLVLIALVAGFVIAGVDVGPAQPIPFSHRLHASSKQIDCLFCHSGATQAANAGIPAVDKCLLCHKVVASRFPPIRQITLYERRGEGIPWKRVNVVPDFVHFSHKVHLNARIDCGRCHGNIKSMDRVRQVHKFDMNFCVTCHDENKALVDCVTCHY